MFSRSIEKNQGIMEEKNKEQDNIPLVIPLEALAKEDRNTGEDKTSQDNSEPNKEKSSNQLLQETILQMKKLKKEQHEKDIASSKPKQTIIQDLKKFLQSQENNPKKAGNKLSGFPKNLSAMKKKQQYTILRGLYPEFRLVEWKDHEYACDVCLKKDSEDDNLILICDLCDAGVHQKCYGNELGKHLPEGNWYCSRCKFLIDNQLEYRAVRCIFCPELKGIIKQINGSELLWGHISCVLNIPQVFYLDGEDRETVSLEVFYRNPFPSFLYALRNHLWLMHEVFL